MSEWMENEIHMILSKFIYIKERKKERSSLVDRDAMTHFMEKCVAAKTVSSGRPFAQ